MKRSHSLWCSALLLGALVASAPAQIKSFTLEEMVTTADNAVYGQIIASRVFRVDHPVDGDELYFTELTIQGRSLKDGTPTTVAVTYNGGFINETEGVFNSEAPAKDDVKLGNKVVAFYVWSDNLGGDVAANALIAAHGGLYRTVDGPRGAAVLGRGEGYAVRSNVRMSELESSLEHLYKAKR
jgi:hypothetical protein